MTHDRPDRARASFAQHADVDLFLEKLRAFESGELSADAWRAFRLVNGAYPQRQGEDLAMLRVKIPQGVLAAPQLLALAEVADRFSRGFGHLTTRQNLQLHFLRLADVEPALRILADAGLTTREACGNSVRNVTSCPYAGVAHDEVFDPTPYAEAVTRHFLRTPLATSLPRKFKIGFEGCPEDHALTAINDIGFRARIRTVDGVARRGFTVAAGGGTSTVPTSARLLVEFLPAGEILALAEAIVRVFHRLGDYEHRQRNRLKFLVKKLGWDGFRNELEADLAAVRKEGTPALPFDPERPPEERAPTSRASAPDAAALGASVRASPPRGPGTPPAVDPDSGDAAALAAWRRTNVRAQRQAGYAAATVTLPLGDITTPQLRALAALAAAYGDGAVRFDLAQNAVLRWVPDADVPRLFAALAAIGLGKAGAGTAAKVVSCPGAESCRLAVTSSRGVGRDVEAHLRGHGAIVDAAGAVDIKVSGCPNGCGQHHVAAFGLQGRARKVGGAAAPQYFVLLGGGVGDDGARFGRLAAKIPARRVGAAVERLLGVYTAERNAGERAAEFFARLPADRAKTLLADLAELTPETARPEDFIDLGDDQPFSLSGEGA
ncbi:MAG: nitrite/sulfite reductase [Anaeromyxobacteraceae bacterium]